MKTTIFSAPEDVSELELEDFEEKLNIKLPKYYRQFLLKYGGGYPSPDKYNYLNKSTYIMPFYDLETLIDYEEKNDLIKYGFLSVGTDVHNFHILVGLLEDNFDKAYILEHNVNSAISNKVEFENSKLFLLAENFSKLLNNFIDFPIVDFPFEKYCEKNNIKKIKKLLDEGLDPNTTNELKESLLIIAIANNKFEIVKLLIERGANINYVANNTKKTALIKACELSNHIILEYLINHGANTNITDINVKNPIEYFPPKIKMWKENTVLSQEDKKILIDNDTKCYELLKKAEKPT